MTQSSAPETSGSPSTSDEAGLPREAYKLLANANLLRMRGCWEDAIEKCMQAMRLAPENATAQSLLGDIYENQGRLDDAIQWYRMALDINPDSPADKLKLARSLEAKRRILAVTAPPAPLPLVPASAVPHFHERNRERSAKPDRLLRVIAVSAAFIVVALIALSLLISHNQWAASKPEPALNETPVVVNPALPPPEGAGAIARDPSEQALLDTLSVAPEFATQELALTDAQIDPRIGRVTITVTYNSPITAPLNQGSVLRIAVRAMQPVMRQTDSKTINQFTLRCLQGGTDAAVPSDAPLVFVGDTTRSDLTALSLDQPSATVAQVQSAFSSQWWSSSVPD